MAKKTATKQVTPPVAEVWDDGDDTTDDNTTKLSTEDGATPGTEADISDFEDTTEPELAEEEGELLDGSEDDITDLEQQDEDLDAVASAVGGDENSPVTAAVKAAMAAATKKVKVAPMADNKMTKADHVRAEIEKRQKSGDSMRPKDIIAALAKKGVTVTAPQVSVMVKKATSGKTTTKAEKPEKIRAASAVKKPMPKPVDKKAAATKPTKTGGLDKQSFDALFDAASFVEKCGGVENAINALSAYERLTAARG